MNFAICQRFFVRINSKLSASVSVVLCQLCAVSVKVESVLPVVQQDVADSGKKAEVCYTSVDTSRCDVHV